MRPRLFFCFLVAFAKAAIAQPSDVLLTGHFIDAATNDTIVAGRVEAVDVRARVLVSSYPLEIQSEMDVELRVGLDVMLYFSAPGYATRLAEMDLSGRRPRKPGAAYIEVAMNVLLTKLKDPLMPDTNRLRLGKCRFGDNGWMVEWTTPEATALFPVRERKDPLRVVRRQIASRIPRTTQVGVYGRVLDEWTRAPIARASITVQGDNGIIIPASTDAAGQYVLNLQFDNEYLIVYSALGRVPKRVIVSTRNVPGEKRIGGFGMNVDMTLFTDIPGEDFSFLEQPVGKASFQERAYTMEWNMDYTRPRYQRLRAILAKHPH